MVPLGNGPTSKGIVAAGLGVFNPIGDYLDLKKIELHTTLLTGFYGWK